ncbi:MAG: membrane protein insertion efficiency factor YidD [bacterium]
MLVSEVDSLIRRVLRGVVRLYQAGPARILPPSCRYFPSCSQYALEALERHSTPRALGLIVWRLMRCQPLCHGGYDPVPSPDLVKKIESPAASGVTQPPRLCACQIIC